MILTDKANVICILSILKEYSDEEHILTMKDIQDKMKVLYDLSPDRRTVYSAIDVLINMGYDISSYAENRIGYWLRDREFSNAELRLLLDAVYAFEYISDRQTAELTEKLRNMFSVNDRKKYNYSSVIRTDKKSPNPQVFLNIETLDEAISAGKKVSFVYLDYDLNKKLVPRRAERYVVNPYAMTCENEHYYLICITEGHTDPGFYRVDMMKDIRISDESISISKKDANLGSTKKVVYAYTGTPESITMLCDKYVLRYVIEKFGKDTVIYPADDGRFTAVINSAPEGVKFWALQYLKYVEIVSPVSLREEIKKIISENKYGI